MPLVSVIIPMFNSAATIAQTLESVQHSTLTDLEIIVVNDGSKDEGPAIVENLARLDARVVIVHRENGGLSAARNSGLDRATGRYVLLLDADDWVLPDGLRTLVDSAERTRAHATYGGFHIRDARGRTLATEEASIPTFGLDDLLDLFFVVPACVLLRRDAIGSTRFDVQRRRVEDYDFWFKLAERGVRWTSAAATVAAYRISSQSLSADHSGMLTNAQDVLVQCMKRCRAGELKQIDRRTLDLGEAREIDRLGRIALTWATRAAIAGHSPDAVEHAIELFTQAQGGKRIEPEAAAAAAHASILFGLGLEPRIDGHEERWIRPLLAWWSQCEARSWAKPGFVRRAATTLAEMTVTTEHLSDAILNHVGPSRTVTLVGFGRNGRRLATRALARGLTVTVRDDRFPTGEMKPGQEMPGAAPQPIDAPIDPGTLVIVTPLDDGSLATRFASSPHFVRWTEARSELAAEAATRMSEHLAEALVQ